MAAPAELLQQALHFHRAGQFAQAEQIYRGILQLDPQQPDALHLLGVLALDAGRLDEALVSITKAIAINPANAKYHRDLGEVYRAIGKRPDAKACFEQALRLEPGFVNGHISLGMVLMEQGAIAEAEFCYREALRLDASSAIAWNNLANVLITRQDLTEANSCLERAISLAPGYAEAHNGLGSVWHRVGDLAKAQTCFERAITCNPQYATAHYNLGVVLHGKSRLDQAQTCFRQAIRINPQFVEAFYQWAAVLKEGQQFAEAQACLEQALRLRPTFSPALNMLASVLEFQGKTGEARAALTQAMTVQPSDDLKIRSALLVPVIYESIAEIQETRSRLQNELLALAKTNLNLPDPEKLTSGSPFFLAYQGGNDRDLMRTLAALYARAAPQLQYVAPHCTSKALVPAERRPIRIGFLSRFFYRHTISKLNAGFIRHLSREHFRVFLFCFPGPDDSMAQSLQQSADEVIMLPRQLETARQSIAEQGLDVLFYTDIGMDPLTYFLAFARLAPIQCVTWGHPVTTGIPTVDCFLSNIHMEPPGAEEHYTERLVRFDHVNTCYEEPKLSAPIKSRQDFGLPENVHLYVCTQSLYKIHPGFDAVLLAIMREDPLGLIVLLSGPQPHWKELLIERFRRTIPEEFRRILFLPEQSQADFLNLQAVADVLLDAAPFGGGNTSLEAFAFGTPIVTMAGQFMRGRITYACYQQMGIVECVANDADEYVHIALRLGKDPSWRQLVRERILANKHLLYENAAAVKELEEFLLKAVGQT